MPHDNLDGIAFVISEVKRLSSAKWPNEKEQSLGEALATLPHPDGHGSIRCGKAALSKLFLLAERAVRQSSYSNRMDVQEVANNLQKIVSDRFIGEGRPINQQQADRAVSAAIKQSSRNMLDQRYYIPCHIGNDKTPKAFQIGDVKFKLMKDFIREISPNIEKYKTSHPADLKIDLSNEAIKYYKSFDWVADIKVSKSSVMISRQKAERIVQLTLDSIHVGLRSYHSKYIRMLGPNMFVDRRGEISSDMEGNLNITGFVSWKTSKLPDNWGQLLTSSAMADFYNLVGIAISEGTTPEPFPRQMSNRLIDALTWYGQAARDEHFPSQTVKFVTAMERLLITPSEKEKEVSQIFRNRGAALASFLSRENYSDLLSMFKDVYSLRSAIVHGSRSPLNTIYNLDGLQADELAARVIIGFTLFCRKEGLTSTTVTDKKLEESFKEIETIAKSSNKTH